MNENFEDTKIRNIVSSFFTKVLVCLIIMFLSLIGVKLSDKIKNFFETNIFSETFNFSSFKSFYDRFLNKEKELIVFNETLSYEKINKLEKGEEFILSSEQVVSSISPGVVVFVGEKDGFNNTIIIQGSDGADIWYGNLDNINVSIYDYVDGGTSLATAFESMYLYINKNDKEFTYEEYKSIT